MVRMIACPTCQKKGSWLEGPHGMFCSDRCQMVDLGKWLGEEHRIASPLTVEDLEELADIGEPDKEEG